VYCHNCYTSSGPLTTQPGTRLVATLVVAGGGGAGGYLGGGGAGGFRTNLSFSVCGATSYPITVGGGGAVGSTPGLPGINGTDSIFSSITSAGGGGGGPVSPSPAGGSCRRIRWWR
jgi:hypothetical protein